MPELQRRRALLDDMSVAKEMLETQLLEARQMTITLGLKSGDAGFAVTVATLAQALAVNLVAVHKK